jgi:diguanylate cyclase (GGDEF)-like protein/PAS domain S-box-containing protein
MTEIEKKHTRTQFGRRVLDQALELMVQGIIILDPFGEVVYLNPEFSRITGYTMDDFTSHVFLQFLIGASSDPNAFENLNTAFFNSATFAGELLCYKKGGKSFWNSITITPIFNCKGEIHNFIVTMLDISDRMRVHLKTKKIAYYDQLTKLPNRHLLNDRLSQALKTSERRGHYGAVLFIDIDKLKIVNDEHGHEVGDMLLCEVTSRIKNTVRAIDTTARFGGDEFIVILSELSTNLSDSITQVENIGKKILFNLSHDFSIALESAENETSVIKLNCSASIGVTLFLGDKVKPPSIIKQADIAMYEAKKSGGKTVMMYPNSKLITFSDDADKVHRSDFTMDFQTKSF